MPHSRKVTTSAKSSLAAELRQASDRAIAQKERKESNERKRAEQKALASKQSWIKHAPRYIEEKVRPTLQRAAAQGERCCVIDVSDDNDWLIESVAELLRKEGLAVEVHDPRTVQNPNSEDPGYTITYRFVSITW